MKEEKEKIDINKVIKDMKSAFYKKKIYMPKRYSGDVSLNLPGGIDDLYKDKGVS